MLSYMKTVYLGKRLGYYFNVTSVLLSEVMYVSYLHF
jgi:hypothetical protein